MSLFSVSEGVAQQRKQHALSWFVSFWGPVHSLNSLPFWLWMQSPCCIIIFTVLINSCSCFPPGFHLPPSDLLGDYIVQMVDTKIWTWTLKFLLNLIATVMVWGCGTFKNELGLRGSVIRNRVTALSLEQLSLLESSIVIVAVALLIK